MSDRKSHGARLQEQELIQLLADNGIVTPETAPHLTDHYLRRGRRMRAEAARDLTRALSRRLSRLWRQVFVAMPRTQVCGRH